MPDYINQLQARKEEILRQEDNKANHIETNNIYNDVEDAASDRLWQYEKEAAKRVVRTSQEVSIGEIVIYIIYSIKVSLPLTFPGRTS